MAYGYYGNPGYINPYMNNIQNYQQYQPQQQVPPQIPQNMPPVKNSSDMIWIQGEAAAKSYLVAPNNTVVLWDSENPCIYVKSADGAGMPTMRTFEIREKLAQNANAQFDNKQEVQNVEYALKGDFEALRHKVDDLSEQVENIPKASKAKKKEGTENE